MNFRDEKGQILVESMIAITIGVVALTGVLNLLTSSIGVNKDINQRITGTYLAMEGVEIVKSLIDRNYAQGNAWNDGLATGSYEVQYDSLETQDKTNNNNNLHFNPSSGLYSYDSNGTETSFNRTVQISGGTQKMEVRSTVEWNERGETRQVTVEDHFYDWRP